MGPGQCHQARWVVERPSLTFGFKLLDSITSSILWHAGADPSKLLLVGHSAGAHLCALVATDSRYLDEVGMLPREIQGVVGLSGPYSVRKLVTQTSRFVRFATYW